MRKERKLIHLRFKDDGNDHYFGSKKAIFSIFSRGQLGVSYNYLAQLKLPYENSKVVIKEGELISSKQQNNKK